MGDGDRGYGRERAGGGDDPVVDGELCESGRAISTVVLVSVSTGGVRALRGGQGEWGELDWILQH